MPELDLRTSLATGEEIEPLLPVRENRIDPPHRLANGREELKSAASAGIGDRAGAATTSVADEDAEIASLAMVQQLRLQAQQLSERLHAEQLDLDRREADLQARFAHVDQQERNNRLWLKDRHEELAEHERALAAREAQLAEGLNRLKQRESDHTLLRREGEDALQARRRDLDRREASIRDAEDYLRTRSQEIEVARVALEDAGAAHDQLLSELEKRTDEFDHRRSAVVEMVTRFLAGEAVIATRPKRRRIHALPTESGSRVGGDPHYENLGFVRDEFDELAELLADLQMRRKNLGDVESLLARAQGEVDELRQALLAERKQFYLERENDRRRRDESRRRAEVELERHRQALESGSQQLELRRAAVDQMRAELTLAQREALENRLAAEELLAQLSGAVPPAQLSHQIARLKARLTEGYRLEQAEVASGRSQMETLAAQVSQQHEQILSRKRELERWLRECEADVQAAAARLADRECLLEQHRDTLEKQRFDWEHERQEYQHEIRRLLAELGQ